MLPFIRWMIVAATVVSPLLTIAEAPKVIEGGVYLDRASLASRQNFDRAAGVTVRLYRDGGDRTPSQDDALVSTIQTNADGVYLFRSVEPGDYFVTVDSRTFGTAGAWPEQTFGPAGAICAQPDGRTRVLKYEGPCVGGRSATGSDDASSLATSEHVALVPVRDSSPTRNDFAFGYDLVTSTADAEDVQGSLRQFVKNANAVSGPNHMHFVPLTAAAEQNRSPVGVPPRWWTITLTSPLPELNDTGTTIDGTAYNFVSLATFANVNSGRVTEPYAMRGEDRMTLRVERPELEIKLAGTNGIVCNNACDVLKVALHGTDTAIVARGDSRIEHVLIGAGPDGTPVATTGVNGVEFQRGSALARDVIVTGQTIAGLVVGPEARLDARNVEITRCGDECMGGGVVLLSGGSTVKDSAIMANGGAGVLVGSFDGEYPSNANTIDNCTISRNQAGVVLGPGSSRNVIASNEITWNRLGGVTASPFGDKPYSENPRCEKQQKYGDKPPRENRLSANRFNENGLRPIILNVETRDPNMLSSASDPCARSSRESNDGISVPKIREAKMTEGKSTATVTISGTACAGDTVELYQAFLTPDMHEHAGDATLPRVRHEQRHPLETLDEKHRERALPSIGEFNYLGTTTAGPDGAFTATYTLPFARKGPSSRQSYEETTAWGFESIGYSEVMDRVFAAVAIDAAGNTSEMSTRFQPQGSRDTSMK